MPESTKKFVTDEIEIVFSFNEENNLNNIKIDITEEGKDLYPPVIETFNKSLVRDAVSRGIMQILMSQGQASQKSHKKKEAILTKKQCPNCGGRMELIRPCCQEKKKLEDEGIVAILSCNKCGQKSWVTKDELPLIPIESEGKNA